MSGQTGDDSQRFEGFSARRVSVPIIGSTTPVTPTRATGIAPGQLFAQTQENPSSPTHTTRPSSPLQGARVGAPVVAPTNSPSNPFVTPMTSAAHQTGSTQGPTTLPAPAINTHTTATAPTPSTAQTDQLAAALALLAQTLGKPRSDTSERNNVHDPDTFDGSDPNKLRTFLAQLELVFMARPRTYPDEPKKVTYAISYLRGTALQWFEPYLLEGFSGNPPLWMSDYSAFAQELRENFGPYDATGSAEHDLENLRMSENQRITKYITQFSRLATQVRWDMSALRYQFYKGLPARLKDRISEVGKPQDLHTLRELAQSLDSRYWERRTEQLRESGTARTPKTSDSKSTPPRGGNNSGASGSASSAPKATSTPTPRTPNKATNKTYSDKLGKDGKLTQEERQRRFANNLCMFCGASGHIASACPKKSSSAAKARAAQAVPVPAVATPAAPVTKN